MSSVTQSKAKIVIGMPDWGSLPRRAWKMLRSLRFAVVLMALIALACIVGTLVKQEPYDPAKAIDHYGRALGLLIGLLGLNQLYHTWWFVGLLGLFALSTTACALSRRRLRLRSIGSMAVHLSILFIVAGAMLRGIVGLDGVVTLAKGQTVDSFQTDGGVVPLGFALRLDDFQVHRYADDAQALLVEVPGQDEPARLPIEVGKPAKIGSDGATVEILRYLPHFMMDGKRIYSASEKPANPAIQVRVSGPGGESTRWLFAKFPGVHSRGADDAGPQMQFVQEPGPVKAFESHVAVLDGDGQAARQATVLVNSPLRAGRYTLYQLSYDPETEQSSTLEVVYDPGVPLVFIGFALMPLGIAFVFYVQPLLGRKGRKDV